MIAVALMCGPNEVSIVPGGEMRASSFPLTAACTPTSAQILVTAAFWIRNHFVKPSS